MGRTRLVSNTTPAPMPGQTGGPAVADELRRLMPRDLWLLRLLADHQTPRRR